MIHWIGDILLFAVLLALVFGAIGIGSRFGAKGCAVTLVLLVVVGVAIGWWHRSRARELERIAARFEDALPAWLAAATEATPAGEVEICARARLLIVEDGAPHRLQLRLPDRLQAMEPATVGTLAILDCEELVVGKYRRAFADGGRDAIQHSCKLEIFDLGGRRRFAPATLRGSEPPSRPGLLGQTQGSFPDDEILARLRSLPKCGNVVVPPSTPPLGALEFELADSSRPALSAVAVESVAGTAHALLTFRAIDRDGDLDLLAEQRVYVVLSCPGVMGTRATSATAWEPETGRATVRVDPPHGFQAGECGLSITVRDAAGNSSDPVATTVDFR